MIEMAESEPGLFRRTFGGDTLNTAVYLARILRDTDFAVDYVTAIGDDPFSAEMIEAWRAEGIGVDLVARIPGKLPGLYLIATDKKGERSFHYWRSAAAARAMFDPAAGDAITLAGSALVYLSGITVAIIDDAGRDTLIYLLDAVRAAGGRVAFDSNYRPALWPYAGAARRWIAEIWRRTDIALPSRADEAALFGDASSDAVADRLHELGAREVVVKDENRPCLVSTDSRRDRVAQRSVERPLDTTAAGDSFNAAYLAARLLDRPVLEAAAAGHGLAATVILHRGAIIAPAHMPARPVEEIGETKIETEKAHP